MKIDLNLIETEYNINLDDYTKLILTKNNNFESVDECKPVNYIIEDDNLYTYNNYIVLFINTRPPGLVETPPKIIVSALDKDGDVFATDVNLKYFSNHIKVYSEIKNTLEELNAKYLQSLTPEVIKFIIDTILPRYMTKNFTRAETLENKYDTTDF